MQRRDFFRGLLGAAAVSALPVPEPVKAAPLPPLAVIPVTTPAPPLVVASVGCNSVIVSPYTGTRFTFDWVGYRGGNYVSPPSNTNTPF